MCTKHSTSATQTTRHAGLCRSSQYICSVQQQPASSPHGTLAGGRAVHGHKTIALADTCVAFSDDAHIQHNAELAKGLQAGQGWIVAELSNEVHTKAVPGLAKDCRAGWQRLFYSGSDGNHWTGAQDSGTTLRLPFFEAAEQDRQCLQASVVGNAPL